MRNNGLLSKQLQSLLSMEIISKRFPINRPEDKKKTSYELCDNMLRFYYAFVYRNKSALAVLGANAFYDEYIAGPVTTFISRRFEEQCRSFFSLLARSGHLPGVTNIGTYWYDDSENRRNGEFDVVLQRRDVYDIYEVRYHSSPMSEKELECEAAKIRNIKSLPLGRIGFVSASGFDVEIKDYDCISGDAVYLVMV